MRDRADVSVACAGGTASANVVRSWAASGADINVVDTRGETPLMRATFYEIVECVAELLRLGADARCVNNCGETALHVLAHQGHDAGGGAEVVRLLVAAGCDAAVRDNDGRTAVELARHLRGAEWGREVEGWVAAAMA